MACGYAHNKSSKSKIHIDSHMNLSLCAQDSSLWESLWAHPSRGQAVIKTLLIYVPKQMNRNDITNNL